MPTSQTDFFELVSNKTTFELVSSLVMSKRYFIVIIETLFISLPPYFRMFIVLADKLCSILNTMLKYLAHWQRQRRLGPSAPCLLLSAFGLPVEGYFNENYLQA